MTDPVAPLYELGRIGGGAALAVALILGVGFGWFLERGGLGNARKLAGQFYLADFTVFKVMFSAIVTAMLGLFWLGKLGVVDVSRVYVPETYLLPQLVGGLVFGAGFVIGGLCPGTSCVAAATGRLDGFAVVGGLLGGIWLFGEAFPLVDRFYASTARGTLTLPALFSVPHGVVVFAVVAIALVAFAGAGRLEQARAPHVAERVRTHRWLAVTGTTLGVLAFAAGDPYPAREGPGTGRDVTSVTAIAVARWIREGRPDVHVVDIRADSLFDVHHIPGAERIALDQLAARAWQSNESVVVYATNDADATRAVVLLTKRGVANAYVLRGGLLSWIAEILEPRLAPLPASATSDAQAARREQLELSRFFGGTPFVSPDAVPPAGRPLPAAAGLQSEAAAVARIIRRGC